jgi:predicted RecB family endonuclease
MDENSVIDAVCRYLEGENYRVLHRCRTTERGTDIVAEQEGGKRYLIEAKGGTSSRPGSPRHGKAYTQSQVFDVVAKGILVAMRIRAEHAQLETSVALAIPEGRWFEHYLGPIRELLIALRINVLVAAPDLSVRRL